MKAKIIRHMVEFDRRAPACRRLDGAGGRVRCRRAAQALRPGPGRLSGRTARGRINGAFRKAGLIDEIGLLIYLGIEGVPGVFECVGDAGERPAAGRSLRHIASETLEGGMVWLRYRVEESPVSA